MTTNIHPQSEYYLHENGSVIYKPHGDVDANSPFVRKVWNANFLSEGPITYLKWLKELKDLGANTKDLVRLWNAQNMDKWVPSDNHAEIKGFLGI